MRDNNNPQEDAIHVLQIRPITFVYANMNNLHSAWVRLIQTQD